MSTPEVKIKLAVDGAAQVQNSLSSIEGGIERMNGAMSKVGQYGSALLLLPDALNLTVGAAMRAADAVTTLNTQLRLSSASSAQAAQAYEALFSIAQRSRVSFTELGTTYAAIARAGNEMGISQTRLLSVTQSISQAMTIGGGSAASMQAALVQLGQGLSSGTLRGEELNSIMEQTPRLAKAIADGLGVPIGKLRELGAAGQLTGEQVISALEKSGPALAKEMESATLTVSQSFTMLSNSVTKFIGEADKASGASSGLAGALKTASSALDIMGGAIKEHETAFAVITYGLAGAATAAGLATLVTRLYELRVATLALGAAANKNPFFLAITAVATMGGALVALGDQFTSSVSGMRADAQMLKQEIDRITAAAKGADLSAKDQALVNSLTEKRNALQQKLAMLEAENTAKESFRAKEINGMNELAAAGKASVKDLEALTALRNKLAKVPESYIKDMQETIRLREAGLIGDKEYNNILATQQAALLKATEGSKKKAEASEKARAATAAESESIKVYAGTMAALAKVQEQAAEKADSLSKTQALLRDVQASPQWAQYSRQMQEQIIYAGALAQAEEDRAAATTAAKRATEEVAKATDASNQSMVKSVEETIKQAVAEEQRVAKLGLTIEQLAALRIAELDVLIAQQEVAAQTPEIDDARLKAIETQIAALKRLRAATAQGTIKELSIETAKETAKEWKKGWEETDRIAREAFTNWAENGTSMAETIGKSLKKALLSAIYDATIKPIALQIFTTVSGALGMTASGGGGSSLLGGFSNAISTGSSAYKYGTAAYDWFTGAGAAANPLGVTGGTSQSIYGLSSPYASNGMGLTTAGADGGTLFSGQGAASGGMSMSPGMAAGAIMAGFVIFAGIMHRNMLNNYSTSPTGSFTGNYDSSGGLTSGIKNGGNNVDYAAIATAEYPVFDKDGNLLYMSTSSTNQLIASQMNTSQAEKIVGSLSGGYQSTAQRLGITPGAASFAYGGNTGEQGKNPNFALNMAIGGTSFVQGETALTDESLQLAMSRAIFTGITGSDLPKAIKGIFDGMVPADMSQQQINDALNTATAYADLHTQMQALPFEYLKDMSYAAAKGLVTAAGGMEALGSSLGTYYDKFYSPEEKRTQSVKNINSTLAAGGVAGFNADNATRDQYKAMVEAAGKQDMSVEKNAKAYYALISVAGAFDMVTPAAEAAAASVATVNKVLETLANDRKSLEGQLATAQGRPWEAQGVDLSNEAQAAAWATNESLRAQITAQNAANETIKTNNALTDEWLVLTKQQTQDQIDLKNGVDASTIALRNQIKTEQDRQTALEAAKEAAEQVMAKAKADADALAATNKTWIDQLSVLTGKETERSQQLSNTADSTTRSYMKQVWAMQDLQQTMAQVDSAIAQIHGSVTDSIFNMRYGLQDNPGKYEMLDKQAKGYDDAMLAATDITVIAKNAQSEIDTINKAWALLDPTQQTATLEKYEASLARVDAYVTSKGADAVSIKKQEAADLGVAVGDAVEAAIAGLVQKVVDAVIAQAAATSAIGDVVKQPVEVNLTVSAPQGSEVSVS